MKKTTLLTLPVVAFMALAATAHAGAPAPKNPVAPAPPPEEEGLGISFSGGYDTKYIFRGVDFGDHLVWGALTIPVKLTDKLTFTFAPWYGNIADGEYDELDLVAGLTYDLGFGTVGVGYTWYYFPFSGFDTHEPNVTFSMPLGPVNWTSGAYMDTEADAGDIGWYFETGIDATIKINDMISIVPAAKISYCTDYYGVDGFNNILLKLGVPIALTKTATLTPYIAGSIAIDGLDDIGEDDYLFGGVSLTVTF